MMDCLIIGDSIASGVSDYRKDCVSIVKRGVNSKRWGVYHMNRPAFDMAEYNTAIISLGTNDTDEDDTEENLSEIRATVKAKLVYWIMPAVNERAQKAILKIARYKNDKIVYMKEVSRDGIHPTEFGYRWIAFDTKR